MATFVPGIFGKEYGNFLLLNPIYLKMKLLSIVFCLTSTLFMTSCSKKSTNPTPPPVETEQKIVITLDPDPGASSAVSMSANYSFKVKITSKLPTGGVLLEYTTKKDSDNSILDPLTQVNSSVNTIDVTTGSLESSTLYIVTVTVKSKSQSSNTATKTFKVARK
jgi:hypothetical protein